MTFSEEQLQLSEHQLKLIKSGWGSKVIEDVEVKRISYDSDGVPVEGYLAHPKDLETNYPLIIWNRGGHLNDGKIDSFLAKGIFGEIASWGHVVLASQYREKDEYGGNDVNDILNLIPLGESISFCDTNNIGMEGWSRGGMMAYKVLTKTHRIKCAVIIAGLANLVRGELNRSKLIKVHEELFRVKDEDEFVRRKKERSAVYFADQISRQTNLLLIHGTADKTVSHNDSVDMCEILKSYGVNCELRLIEGGDHYLRKHRKEVSNIRREWFDKFLKGKND